MDAEDAVRESMHLLGVDTLKEKQEEAIMSFLQGNDTFVSLPTGYGKSLIYALLPYTFDMISGKHLLIYLYYYYKEDCFCFQQVLNPLWCVFLPSYRSWLTSTQNSLLAD